MKQKNKQKNGSEKRVNGKKNKEDHIGEQRAIINNETRARVREIRSRQST